MRDLQIVIALSTVAVTLTITIGILVVIQPAAALGLSPVLAAIAIVIRAIRGTATSDRRRQRQQGAIPPGGEPGPHQARQDN